MSGMNTRHLRPSVLALVAGLFLAPMAAHAAPTATPVPVAASSAASLPSQQVSALDNALIAAMKAGSAGQDFKARYALLAPVIEQAYDLPVVTKNSVGFLWSTLPAEQQQQLIALFTQFTITSYVSQFDSYGGQSLAVQPGDKALGNKKIVQTLLTPKGGSSVQIDYVVGQDNGSWKINDVLLNGTISQVAVHASDFASLVKSGDATQLIAALKAKIKTLQNL